MIKTILFDLDGTLIETPKIILSTFQELFDQYIPHVQLTDALLSSFLGQTLFKTFETYVDDPKKVDELVKIYRDVSEEKINLGLSAYRGAKEVLIYLRKKGIQVGVVTSKLKTVATEHLIKTDLFDEIQGLIGYEDVINHKPDPEPILKAIAYFNSEKEETLYVGDHENDIIAAKKAGILTCAVSYSLRLQEMLFENPDFVIDELKHIKDLV
ncbi:MAG: HAD-IA family hydrolase [Acholeplasmataceae bacterium]